MFLFDETFAVVGVVLGLNGNFWFVAVLFDEGKHVFVDDFESVPSLSDSSETGTGNEDVVDFDELGDLDEGVADGCFLADLADGVDDGVADGLFEVDQVGDDLLQLETIVELQLVQQHLLVKTVFQFVVEQRVLEVLLVVGRSGPHWRHEFDI